MKNTNLIIGKTNTGKTKAVLFKEVKEKIEKEENIFILDSREEYYETFSEEFKEKGYNVLVLNLNDATKSNGYNPLLLPYKLYKENKKDLAMELINNFAYEICKEKNQIDPFWANSAASYLTGLILIMFKNASESQINLGSLTMMVNQAETSYKDSNILKTYLSNIDLLDSSYIALSGVAFAPNETRGSILSVVKQKLNEIVMKENLLNLLSTSEIDLEKITNKTVIFVIGKTKIANILLNQLFSQIKVNKIPFNFILEDINNYERIESLEDMIKDATYNNIKVYVTARTTSELSKNYSEDLINYFENKIETNEENQELIETGNFSKYPKLNQEKHEYFNFKEFVEQNM